MGDPRSLLICKVFETLILNLSLPTSDIALFSRRGVLQNKECLKSSLAAVEERLNGWIASIRDADKYEKTDSTIFDTDSHFMSFIGVINGNNFTDDERRIIIQSLDQSNLTNLTNNIRVLQSHINIWKTEVNGATPTEVNGATPTEVNGATPTEVNGATPAVVAKRPTRDDKMFYPPGSLANELTAAARKLKLKAKAKKAAEISQSSPPAVVAKYPIRDDKMFYPPGSLGYELTAATAARKLKLEAIEAAEISQSSPPAVVAKYPIRDDKKMFYPPGSHGYVIEAAAAAQKLKLEAKAIKAAEISQSSREAAVNNNEPIDTNAVVGGARRRKLSASNAPVKRVTPKKKGRRAKRRSELDL